jgi:hypothetical protein
VILVVPSLRLRAERLELRDEPERRSRFEQTLREVESRRLAPLRRPLTFPPHSDRAPFGGVIEPRYLAGADAAGKLLTPWGHVSWFEEEDDLAGRFPASFSLPFPQVRREGRGRRLAPGLNYLQLRTDALGDRRIESVLAELSAIVRIIGVLPESTLLVDVDPDHLARVWKSTVVARTRPLAPYEKIATDYGVRHEMNRNEAARPDVLARISFVPGTLDDRVMKQLRNMPGVSGIARDLFTDTVRGRVITSGHRSDGIGRGRPDAAAVRCSRDRWRRYRHERRRPARQRWQRRRTAADRVDPR